MRGQQVLCFLALSLGGQPLAPACSVNFIPWQSQAVWPLSEEPMPLNTQLHVRIPIAASQALRRPKPPVAAPMLRGGLTQTFDEPVSVLAQSLTLQELTTTARVPTRWYATAGSQEAYFVLVPQAPLRPQTEYVVMMDSPSGRERLGTFRTGLAEDRTPPAWRGLKRARYVPAQDQWSDSCPSLPVHGPLIELAIHEATDEGQVRYAVWVAENGEALRYQDRPQAYLDPKDGLLRIGSLPRGADHVRIGVRATDVAGNLSPPGELELKLPPGGR